MASTWLSMAELQIIIGKEDAKRLCIACGGVAHYIPQKPTENHPFVAVIGFTAFAMLCREFSGREVMLPNERKPEPQKGAIVLRLEKGYSHRAIAQELGVTQRWVETVSSQMRNNQQFKLPL